MATPITVKQATIEGKLGECSVQSCEVCQARAQTIDFLYQSVITEWKKL